MVENKLMKSKKKAGFRPLALCIIVCIVMSQLMFTIPSLAYTVEGVNLALNKPATASQRNSIYETADKAVNASKDYKWCTGWTTAPAKLLMIDLYAKYDINRWVVYHAGTREQSSYNTRDFRLQYSQDGTNWTTADSVINNKDSITERCTRTFSARYIRLYVDYSDQVNNACARIYDFQLYYDHEDDPTTNIAYKKTATASGWVNSYEAPMYAVDEFANEKKWCTGTTTSPVKWLMVDLGKQYYFNRFVVYHAGGHFESVIYNTRDFKLQYSQDGTNWATAATITNNAASITKRKTSTILARYVRLYIDYSDQVDNSCARIYDFQLYYDNLAIGKTATASEAYSDQTPDKAINGTYLNEFDKWCTGWSTKPKWLAVDLGSVNTVRRFKVVHAGAYETTYPQYNTRSFRIQTSSDGVNWVDVYTVSNNTSSVTEAYFPSPIDSRYFRLKIDQGQQSNDACARIYEFQLYSY